MSVAVPEPAVALVLVLMPVLVGAACSRGEPVMGEWALITGDEGAVRMSARPSRDVRAVAASA